MRRFYLVATVLFWLLVAAFWAGSRGLPPAEESIQSRFADQYAAENAA